MPAGDIARWPMKHVLTLFGLRWTRWQERQFRAIAALSRAVTPILPKILRINEPWYLRIRAKAIARDEFAPRRLAQPEPARSPHALYGGVGDDSPADPSSPTNVLSRSRYPGYQYVTLQYLVSWTNIRSQPDTSTRLAVPATTYRHI